MKRIVILGAGFAGLDTYNRLHRHIHDRADITITIIDRNNYSLFTPMLHEVATGSVGRNHVVLPIRQAVQCCIDRFHQAEVQQIDFDKKIVTTSDGNVTYDHLVIGLGAAVNFFGVKGAAQHTLPLKTLHDAAALRNHIIARFERATKEKNAKKRKALLHFVIIGAGPTGVELAGQLADLVYHAFTPLYQEIDYAEVKITLVHRAERVLHMFRESTSRRALKRLQKMDVDVKTRTGVTEVGEAHAMLDSGKKLATHTVIWAAGTASAVAKCVDKKWCNKRGQILVTPELHIPEHPDVFVLGDNAALDGELAPFAPQTAQAAQDAAKVVAYNMRASLKGKKAHYKTFKFIQKGYIMPIGDWYAVAEIGPFSFGGRLAWWMRRTVFIQNLRGALNRLQVTFDWTVHSFMHRDTSEF